MTFPKLDSSKRNYKIKNTDSHEAIRLICFFNSGNLDSTLCTHFYSIRIVVSKRIDLAPRSCIISAAHSKSRASLLNLTAHLTLRNFNNHNAPIRFVLFASSLAESKENSNEEPCRFLYSRLIVGFFRRP